jgi:hypothetical protein
MFEAMTPKGRLSVIQKKQLCQFRSRHPDTQPCPSHSLPACPIRGCMRMHHRMPHRALMREEARPVVLGMAQSSGGRDPGDDLLTSDTKDSTLVTSDEEEGGEPEKSRLCMQMVSVEANGIVQGLHTLYEKRVDEKAGILAGAGGAANRQRVWRSRSTCHWMSLPAADRRERKPPGDLRLRGGGDHHRG